MKSWMISSVVITLVIECLFSQAQAYETPTHSRISDFAINQSVLRGDPALLRDMGVPNGIDNAGFPAEVPVDENNPVPDKTYYLMNAPVRRIIKAGAVLEDRASNSLHHFYDPMNGGRGLVLGGNAIGVTVGIASPDWMFETDTSLLSRKFRQDFSYSDSLEYFYKALTSNQAATRQVNFGLMFRGIGHLIHHIQDMAQPQHVRNDQHCDGAYSLVCRPLDNPSHYEKYTDEVRGRIVPGQGTYSIPAFPLMRHYWVNASGTGMAEFTQSNFISQGTNFDMDSNGNMTGNTDYPLPIPYLEALTSPIDLLTLLQQSEIDPVNATGIMQNLQCGTPLLCMIDFIPSQVMDFGLSGSAGFQLNSRASSISLLDDELESTEDPHAVITTYNRFNFHAAYPFLIPRAIAYSAGMINHFFRGRISIVDAEVDQENNATITVMNNSSYGNTLTDGRFELYYESTGEGRKRVPELRISSGGLPLSVGASLQLSMSVPEDVDNEAEKPYLLVFNALDGKLGAEGGIAASLFDISLSGRVVHLSRNANFCPDRVYGVAIAFPTQPENDGRVVLEGEQSGASFDFSTIPAGADIIRAGAMWRHKVYEYTGEYMYEVTYRYNDSEADPCTSPWLGPWIQDEKVQVVPPIP